MQRDNEVSNFGGGATSDRPVSNEHEHSAESAISTHYAPGTGRRLLVLAGTAALALLVAFLATHYVNSGWARSVDIATGAAASALPLVDVAIVRPASTHHALVLPGDTAAWYQSSIYARVSGYVGKWYVDIGDRVSEGQVLATIETPELDAELVAANAKLVAAQAEVNVRKAEVDFAQSTYQRWKDAPKGVVSEQERQDKKASYATAVAQPEHVSDIAQQEHIDRGKTTSVENPGKSSVRVVNGRRGDVDWQPQIAERSIEPPRHQDERHLVHVRHVQRPELPRRLE